MFNRVLSDRNDCAESEKCITVRFLSSSCVPTHTQRLMLSPCVSACTPSTLPTFDVVSQHHLEEGGRRVEDVMYLLQLLPCQVLWELRMSLLLPRSVLAFPSVLPCPILVPAVSFGIIIVLSCPALQLSCPYQCLLSGLPHLSAFLLHLSACCQ